MRGLVAGSLLWAAVLGVGCGAWGQMHKVAKPEQVVRAVGVYEWTGDLAKPKGMRLVPVTIFINGEVQDAAVYMARPVPMALLTGNLYELDDAGVSKGLLDVKESRHVQIPAAADLIPYDDGWFGYGSFEAPAAPKAAVAGRHAPGKVLVNGKAPDDPDKPHFSSKGAQPGAGDDSAPAKGSPEDVKVDSGADDKDNVDRPTLRRRAAVDPKQAKKDKKARDQASVTGEKTSLNDDPDRPHMGRRTQEEGDDLPALNGLPADMHQMVAVSDPKNREMHPFARAWEDETEHQVVLAKMRVLARAELVKYGPVPAGSVMVASGVVAAPGAATASAPPIGKTMTTQDTSGGAPVLRRNHVADDAAAKEQVTAPVAAAAPVAAPPVVKAPVPKTPAARAAAARRAAAAKKKAAAMPPVEEALVDEELKGFLLSYGGDPTFVYTAHTAGTGAALRYVTIVAQADGVGHDAKAELKVAMRGVTDAAHLDRTAWMRFVDVVDVEASNRASLLFELRGQSSRQFGLYRVIGGKSDTVFVGGTTQ